MTEPTTATAQLGRAVDLQRREIRARMLVDSVVAYAMDESRKDGVDPYAKPLQFAHDLARTAAALLIERIYTEDQEIAELRAELELYKKQLETLIRVTPPRLTIPIITNPEGKP